MAKALAQRGHEAILVTMATRRRTMGLGAMTNKLLWGMVLRTRYAMPLAPDSVANLVASRATSTPVRFASDRSGLVAAKLAFWFLDLLAHWAEAAKKRSGRYGNEHISRGGPVSN